MDEIYKTLKAKKQKDFKRFEDKLSDILSSNPTELSDYFYTFLFNEPKRLRPLFGFLILDLLNIKPDKKLIAFFVSVELLHSASLIHDDIIDDGTLRRSIECIHKKEGNKVGVLAGDYLLSLGVLLLSEIKIPKLYEIVSNATYNMAKSEIKSLKNRFNTPSIKDYLELIEGKTSSLFLAIVYGIAAIKEIDIDPDLIEFTRDFSILFQIRDDLNNFQNKEKNKNSSDIKKGIYTLPYILGDDVEHGIIDKSKRFIIKYFKNINAYLKDKKNEDLLLLTETLR